MTSITAKLAESPADPVQLVDFLIGCVEIPTPTEARGRAKCSASPSLPWTGLTLTQGWSIAVAPAKGWVGAGLVAVPRACFYNAADAKRLTQDLVRLGGLHETPQRTGRHENHH